ncbi:Os01g0641750 [Oryza sativa Japonica Group]|uniref:Os01g0641750 protein n=1 Tax=Oryza sativa subsp. japonica TaxID=39947 RepID=A0A0P0V5S7_ORYSJ|nr:hypothetical protein EE612_004605 [Oryza sativa]BAS73370.1 Os01g0641750 [Oryza sativa Japonica Group]
MRFPPRRRDDGAVDILDQQYGPVLHPDQQLPQLGVGADAAELEVVDVEAEVVGDRGDQAGLAGAGGAVDEVPPLPRPPRPLVVLLPAQEPVQVVHHRLPQRGVHGQRRERRGVAEPHGPPLAPLVAVQLRLPLPLGHGRDAGHDGREVRAEHHVLVPPVEAQLEHLPRVVPAPPPAAAAAAVAAQAPRQLRPVEHVHDRRAGAHGERDLLRAGAARQARLHQRHGRRGEEGGDVRLGREEDAVVEGAVELLDDHAVAAGRGWRQEEQRAQGRVREDVGDDPAQQHGSAHDGGGRRDGVLVPFQSFAVRRRHGCPRCSCSGRL